MNRQAPVVLSQRAFRLLTGLARFLRYRARWTSLSSANVYAME